MSEQRRWLRFCYSGPQEYSDPEGPPDNVAGWLCFLRAIRSDGIMYQVHLLQYEKPNESDMKFIKDKLRENLETFLEDVPRETIIPNPHPEIWMKGVVYQNGDEWVEVEDGTVTLLGKA